MAEPIRVRGKCRKCGRTVNTTAPKGRATWRGPCPAGGCDGVILARRLPDKAATEPTPTTAPATTGRKSQKVIRVNAYNRTVPGDSDVQQPQPPAGPPAAGSGDGDGQPPAGGGTPPAAAPQAQPVRKPGKPARAAHPETGARRNPYGHLFQW